MVGHGIHSQKAHPLKCILANNIVTTLTKHLPSHKGYLDIPLFKKRRNLETKEEEKN